MTALLLVLAVAAGSWVLRVAFVVVQPSGRVQERLEPALASLATAALAALVAAGVTTALRHESDGDGRLAVVVVVAGLCVAAWRTRSLAVVCGLGLLLVVAMDLWLPR